MQRRVKTACSAALVCALGVAPVATSAPAAADDLGYLINVTVNPAYHFPDAPTALGYGYGLCDRIGDGQRYGELAGSIKNDFNTTDEYAVSYLLSQATQELCPAKIWSLRQSAGGYRPPQ